MHLCNSILSGRLASHNYRSFLAGWAGQWFLSSALYRQWLCFPQQAINVYWEFQYFGKSRHILFRSLWL
jgi:hypothetical protein